MSAAAVSKPAEDSTVANPTRNPFHACWYPVALSSELTPGDVRGIPLLGGRVVVYRAERASRRSEAPIVVAWGRICLSGR
jgi:phenylpropionate dioxygenase-like ring-hydroxylating dioxygenase large terminal subunit